MKRTQKAVLGARVMAEVLGKTMIEILDDMSMENLYLQLRANGYRWDATLERWDLRGTPLVEQSPKTMTPLACQVRVMAASIIDVNCCTDTIVAALQIMGYDVASRSVARENHTGDGARVYLDVLL